VTFNYFLLLLKLEETRRRDRDDLKLIWGAKRIGKMKRTT